MPNLPLCYALLPTPCIACQSQFRPGFVVLFSQHHRRFRPILLVPPDGAPPHSTVPLLSQLTLSTVSSSYSLPYPFPHVKTKNIRFRDCRRTHLHRILLRQVASLRASSPQEPRQANHSRLRPRPSASTRTSPYFRAAGNRPSIRRSHQQSAATGRLRRTRENRPPISRGKGPCCRRLLEKRYLLLRRLPFLVSVAFWQHGFRLPCSDCARQKVDRRLSRVRYRPHFSREHLHRLRGRGPRHRFRQQCLRRSVETLSRAHQPGQRNSSGSRDATGERCSLVHGHANGRFSGRVGQSGSPRSTRPSDCLSALLLPLLPSICAVSSAPVVRRIWRHPGLWRGNLRQTTGTRQFHRLLPNRQLALLLLPRAYGCSSACILAENQKRLHQSHARLRELESDRQSFLGNGLRLRRPKRRAGCL